MSATISEKDEQMSQAPGQAAPQDSDSTSAASSENSSAELDRLRKETTLARKAEEAAFRQLDTLKARNYDLQTQRAETDAEMAEVRAEVDRLNGELEEARSDTIQVESQLATTRDAMEARIADLEKLRMNLEDDLAITRDQAASLVTRYQNRLADIAELGHAISRSESKLARLAAQHEYSILRNHVVLTLAPEMSALHRNLSKSIVAKGRRRADRRVARDRAIIAESGLFDADWYCEFYPDVAQSGIDPLKHYVLYGGYELRDPGPSFSAFKYHKAYPDVTEASMPALLHYLLNGRHEGRRAFKVGEQD